MKRISEIYQRVNEDVAEVKTDAAVIDYKNPNVFVYANEKMSKYAKIFRNQINKRAHKNYSIEGMYSIIGDKKVIMLVSYSDNDRSAVAISPIGNKDNHCTLYYFSDIDKNHNVADIVVSSEESGIMAMLNIFADTIADKKRISMFESAVSEIKGRLLNEAKRDDAKGTFDHENKRLKPAENRRVQAQKALKLGDNEPLPNSYQAGTEPYFFGKNVKAIRELLSQPNAPSIYDIAEEIQRHRSGALRSQSKYLHLFIDPNSEGKGMGQDTINTILYAIAEDMGIEMNSGEDATVHGMLTSVDDGEVERFLQTLGVNTVAKKEAAIEDFRKAKEDIQTQIDLYVEYYRTRNTKLLRKMHLLFIVPGAGGIGKTSIVTKALKKSGLLEDRDYTMLSSKGSAGAELYDFFYAWNGKICVLDDVKEMFAGATRVSMWKNIISGDLGEFGNVGAPVSNARKYYKLAELQGNNRERYYKETDNKNHIPAAVKSEIRKIDDKLTDPKGRLTNKEMNDLITQRDNLIKEYSTRIPDSFTFRGCIIALTNKSLYDLSNSDGMGKQDWQAIKSRADIIPLDPPGWVLWLDDKKTILAQAADDSIEDEFRKIPKEMTDSFVAEVEKLFDDPSGRWIRYQYRVSSNVGAAMRKGSDWVRTLKDGMKTDEDQFE